MQNFDFNSLSEDSGAPTQIYNRNPHLNTILQGGGARENQVPMPSHTDFSPSNDSKNKNENKKQKKIQRLVTFFIITIFISFTLGLVAGIKLTAKNSQESSLIDPKTEEFFSNIVGKKSKNSVKPGSNTEKSPPERKAAKSSRLFVKIFPALNADHARLLAKDLLDNKFPVHYSKLSNGQYFLYTGPYKGQKNGQGQLDKIKKIRSLKKVNAFAKLVKR